MSEQLAVLNQKVLNHFIFTGDLSQFKEEDKLNLMHKICDRLGLDPITRPLELITFPGKGGTKTVWYLNANGCENLAAKHKMSFTILEKGVDKDAGLAFCTVKGTMPDGKVDEATAYVECAKRDMKGEITVYFGLEMANAKMKAETKARRRLIKRLAGIDFVDEDDIKEAQKEQKVLDVQEQYRGNDVTHSEEPKVESPEIYDHTRVDHKHQLMDVFIEKGLDLKNPDNIATAKNIVQMLTNNKVPMDDDFKNIVIGMIKDI